MKHDEYSKLPKSREEARARGLDRYFTGLPCKHGHVAPRYVSVTNCVVCQVEHARRRGGWQARPSRETYLDEVRKIVEQRGGVLLSVGYVSAKTKLKIRCGDQHEFEITPDNLKHGNGVESANGRSSRSGWLPIIGVWRSCERLHASITAVTA